MRRGLLALVVLSVAALSLPAAAQVRVDGNPRWWREVLDAFDRLSRARTYRVRMVPSDAPAGTAAWTWEFDNASSPPASRFVVSFREGSLQYRGETVQIGDQAWQRTTTVQDSGAPQSQCVKLPAQQAASVRQWGPPRPQDVRGSVRMLARTAATHRTPAGQVRPVYVYEFEVRPSGQPPVRNSLTVDRETGLPLRMAFRPLGAGAPAAPAAPGAAPPQAAAMDFYDYGAPVRITIPPQCPRS